MSTNPQTVINPGPIVGAGSRGVIADFLPVPQMDGGIRGWFGPLIVGLVTTLIENGQARPSIKEIPTSGIILPGSPEILKLLPEGNRSWKNVTLFCLPGLNVETDDVLTINAIVYKVVRATDWDKYGYSTVDMIEDYQ